MNPRQVYIVAGLLATIGLGLFLYKYLVLGFPLTPTTRSEVWNVEARLAFDGTGSPVKLNLLLPQSSDRFRILDENFLTRGYGLTTGPREDGNREATWSIRSAKGRQVLYYRAMIARRPAAQRAARITPPPAPAEVRLHGPELEAARALVAAVRAHSADVDTLVSALIVRLNQTRPDHNTALLLGPHPSALTKWERAVDVLALAGVPARIVQGIRLEGQRRDTGLIHWLSAYDGKRWRSFDPGSGRPVIPAAYFPWAYGSAPLAQLTGAARLRMTLSVARNVEAGIRVATAPGAASYSRLLDFSLFSLPIETQTVYRVALMIPLGAFVLVVLRNLVGIRTFGTFMPVLIALAFRETQLLWGLLLFAIVVALGLSVRFYLERLHLLLVPRLASVLIVVVLLMAVISVVSHKLGIERGLSVALFPMVIMTMTIERMSIVWDERGPKDALMQSAGSFLAAAIAYLVMFRPELEHLAFVFPELLLLVLAATLLFGRYSGYRLTELRRFRALAKEGP